MAYPVASLVPKKGLDVGRDVDGCMKMGTRKGGLMPKELGEKHNYPTEDKYNGMVLSQEPCVRGEWIHQDLDNMIGKLGLDPKIGAHRQAETGEQLVFEHPDEDGEISIQEAHRRYLKHNAEVEKRNAELKITPTVNHALPTWRKFLGLFNYNTLLYWIVLSPCVAAGYQCESFWIFLGSWTVLFCFIEYLSYFCEYNWFDMDGIMCGTYALWSYTMEPNRYPGYDYGPLLFNGDTTKTALDAIKDKYDKAFEEMGLEEGMNVLDVGCGLGHWLVYLKVAKKCNVVGINISKTQVAECRARGLDIIEMNWKDVENDKTVREKLYGKFDVVTYWDCVEHFVLARDSRNLAKVDNTYRSVFEFSRNCLKPTSKLRRVWISCMHEKKTDGFWREKLDSPGALMYWLASDLIWIKRVLSIYCNDRTLSGSYPNIERDTLNMNANKENFTKIFQYDMTFDAFITPTSVSTHPVNQRCGNSWEKWFLFSCLIITCPYWLHQMLFYLLESYVWQFNSINFALNVGDATWQCWEDKPVNQKKKGQAPSASMPTRLK